jgi:hypothetical protein
MEGPRWYKRRIRLLGPLYGLLPMIAMGAVALVSLKAGDGRNSGLLGLFAGTTAAPGLLVAGAPLADESRFPLAILASVPLWLILGFVASRRATRRPVATWADYGRELVYLTIAVAIGAAVALLIASRYVGDSLIL